MKSELEPVVCFAGDDYYHSNPHSRYHLTHALHRQGRRVLWVNSIGMNLPKAGRKGFGRKVRQRLRNWGRWLREVEPGFWVLSPIALPLFGNRALERLKTLPFGTWFEFVRSPGGETVRRKLAWYSTLTGRGLFVNQRGARCDERSLDQLARDMQGGAARLVPIEQESLIDRAWNAITSALRQFTGRSPVPARGGAGA